MPPLFLTACDNILNGSGAILHTDCSVVLDNWDTWQDLIFVGAVPLLFIWLVIKATRFFFGYF